jgi:hypothetical protein
MDKFYIDTEVKKAAEKAGLKYHGSRKKRLSFGTIQPMTITRSNGMNPKSYIMDEWRAESDLYIMKDMMRIYSRGIGKTNLLYKSDYGELEKQVMSLEAENMLGHFYMAYPELRRWTGRDEDFYENKFKEELEKYFKEPYNRGKAVERILYKNKP